MRYRVSIAKSAEKQLKRLPAELQRKIAAVIISFELEPRPFGCKKLVGEDYTYRVRVGDYRIIYEIYDREVLVVVLKLGHRREIYR